MKVEYDCEECGEHVVKKRSPATMKVPPRFCSQRCNGASKKGTGVGTKPNKEFDCERCGKHCSVYRSPGAAIPRFCSVRCTGAAQRGSANPAYVSGRHLDASGYVLVRADGRYVLEHRLVMEQTLGRRLTGEEVVHHINHVKDDNRRENLRLFASQALHMAFHQAEKAAA